jgi:hypothetical protein
MRGSAPRAVASAAQYKARSLPLAALIRRFFPYMHWQLGVGERVEKKRMRSGANQAPFLITDPGNLSNT